MRTREAKKVIRKIAKREGISEYEVRREMEKAIRIGFMNGGAGHRWNRRCLWERSLRLRR